MKRYMAQVVAQDGDQWENVGGGFEDLERAARLARMMLQHPDVRSGRVLDLQTDEVIITPEELQR